MSPNHASGSKRDVQTPKGSGRNLVTELKQDTTPKESTGSVIHKEVPKEIEKEIENPNKGASGKSQKEDGSKLVYPIPDDNKSTYSNKSAIANERAKRRSKFIANLDQDPVASPGKGDYSKISSYPHHSSKDSDRDTPHNTDMTPKDSAPKLGDKKLSKFQADKAEIIELSPIGNALVQSSKFKDHPFGVALALASSKKVSEKKVQKAACAKLQIEKLFFFNCQPKHLSYTDKIHISQQQIPEVLRDPKAFFRQFKADDQRGL